MDEPKKNRQLERLEKIEDTLNSLPILVEEIVNKVMVDHGEEYVEKAFGKFKQEIRDLTEMAQDLNANHDKNTRRIALDTKIVNTRLDSVYKILDKHAIYIVFLGISIFLMNILPMIGRMLSR